MSEHSRGMSPGIRPGALPPFHLIDEYAFQELCRDLMDMEPGVATCEVYGRRGQGQRGIDLLAQRQHNDGIEVGQCKRYEKFLPSEIASASDEFFAHWDYWQPRDVRRFVLVVTADLTERKRQDEIATQHARFAEHAIDYEVWSAATLQNRLRPHPGIVGTYCSPADHWIKVICGISSTPGSGSEGQGGINTVVSAAMVGLIGTLTGRLSDELQRRLDHLREVWREGQRRPAEEGIREIRADAGVWDALGTEVRAKVIRLQAALELDLPGGVDRARRLSVEARALDNSASQRRLDALIACVADGPDAALALLDAHDDTDDRHLAAAFHLEAGRFREAQNLIDFSEADFVPSPETYRLQALAFVVAHDLDAARLASQKALELVPRWDSVRFVAAAVDYMSALSPAAWPDAVTEWPVPVEWVYVRRDDASLARLRGAAAVFSALTAGDDRPLGDRRGYETWHLACLANDPDRQEKAVARCRELLASDPTHPGAFAWAVARRFEVDLHAVEKALLRSVEAGEDLQPVLSLVSHFQASGQIDRSEALLHNTRRRFEGQGQIGLWNFWYAQARIAQRDPGEALMMIGESTARGFRRLRSLALHLQAELVGTWETVVRELEGEYETTADAALLFEICSVLAAAKQWEAIADRAELLVEAIGTADVVRLAVRAAYSAQRWELCLTLLDGHRGLFREGKLPHELRGVRIHVLHHLGGISEAISEAEALARDEPTLDNLLDLAKLRYSKGDITGLANVARAVLVYEDLSADSAIQLARSVVAEDPIVAEQLWQRAVEKGVEDSNIRVAVDLGHRLGLDARMEGLMVRFVELGRQGREGIYMRPLEDLLEYRDHHHDRVKRLNEAYRTGARPIHLIARAVGATLVDLYHGRLHGNAAAPDPAGQFALFARHGARATATPLPEEHRRRRLHLDITALLLAQHAEILTLVEEEFSPLRLPSEVVPALIRMREDLLPHQPTQLMGYREILELYQARLIHVVPNETPVSPTALPSADQMGADRVLLLALAQAEGGFVLDHFPIRHGLGGPLELPTEVEARFTSSRAVVESLWRFGPLSEPEYFEALRSLRAESDATVEQPVPAPGTALYCHGNTCEMLYDLGLLRAACERFRVYVTDGTLDRARSNLTSQQQRDADADWLRRLLERLSQGIDTGTYQIIAPAGNDPTADDSGEELDPDESDGLRTLLRFEAQPGDAVWVDDRFSTGYWSRGGIPVFGVVEVLEMLKERERVDQADIYRVLAQLRAANVRFLAPTADEVLYHLGRSRAYAGNVVETRELAVLRRYVAACLMESDLLQPPLCPDGGPNSKTEVSFLIAVDRASVGVLVGVWADPRVDDEIRRARSKWVLDSLFVDFAAMRRLAKLETEPNHERALVAASLAAMITQAFATDWPVEGDGSVLDRYLAWLDVLVLQRRFEAEPLLAPTVARIIRDTLLTINDLDAGSDVPEVIRTIALQFIYDSLPVRLQDELGKDDALLARLEMEAVSTSSIGEHHFRREDFRRVIIAVAHGNVARIRSVDQDKEFIFHPSQAEQGNGQFRVETPDGSDGFTVADDILLVLSESASAREACLRANRHWYDGPSAGFEAWVAKLASTEDPLVRMELAENWRDESTTVFYANLHNHLQGGRLPASPELLPPSGSRLLGHFRLPADAGDKAAFHEVLSGASVDILREDGLDTALERWSGLPVALPTRVTERMLALPAAERRALVKRLLGTATSPVSEFHFLRVLWLLGDSDPVYRRLAERRAVHLFSDEYSTYIAAFKAILAWVGEAFAGWADAQSWAASARLAAEWLHAHRLFTAFVAVGAEMEQIQQIFSRKPRRIAHLFVRVDPAYDLDITHPQRFERLPFLVFGLAHACGGDQVRELGAPLRGVIRTAALRDRSEDVAIADLPLLRDVEQAGNAMGSWLGGISPEVATALLAAEGEWLTSDARGRVMSGALDQLIASPVNDSAWSFLGSVVENLPPRPHLRERLVELALGLDYVGMARENPYSAARAIRTLAAQAPHFASPAAAAHLRGALTTVARALAIEFRDRSSANLMGEGDLLNMTGALLESAADISHSGSLDDDPAALFAVSLEDLLDAWPALASMIFRLVQRLQVDLPVHSALHFARLAARLRSEPSPLEYPAPI